ncbi:MAG TPA: O-antigen ligase family protein [Chloroflexota bacterium]
MASGVRAGARTAKQTQARARQHITPLELGLLTSVAAVALVFLPNLNEGFELPKQVVLRVLVALAIATTALRMLRSGHDDLTVIQWIRESRLLLGAVVLLVLAWTVATLASTSPLVSFWGSYQRWTGLQTQLTFIVVFVMGAVVLTSREHVRRLAVVAAAVASLTSAYAIAQRLQLDPLSWRRGVEWSGQAVSSADRPFSTFGNPDFLAAFLVLSIVLTVGALLRPTRRLASNDLAVWAALGLQVVALLLTGSRAGLLGAGAGLALYGVVRLRPRLRGSWLPAAGAIGLLAVLLVATVSPSTIPTDGSTRVRLALWKTAIQLVLERPWLGSGLNTFGSVVLERYPAEIWTLEPPEFVLDRAHNATLDTLVGMGVFGGLAYVALVGVLGWHIRQKKHTSSETILVLVAALSAHLVEQQFNVEVTAASLLAWLIAGATVGVTRAPSTAPATSRGGGPAFAVGAVGLGLAGALTFAGVQQLDADQAYARAIAAERGGDAAATARELRTSVDRWLNEPTYWHELGRAHLALARSGSTSAYREAIAATEQAVLRDPGNALILSNWAAIAGEAAARLNDQALAARATEAHQRALRMAPGHWLIWRAAGATAFNQRDYQTALAELTRASELFGGNAATWSAIGDTQAALGDLVNARVAYRRALELVPNEARATAGLQRLPPN